MNNSSGAIALEPDTKSLAIFMSKVYLWMFFGLLITAVAAYKTSQYPQIVDYIFTHQPVYWSIAIFQLTLIFILSANLWKINIWLYELIFMIYAASVGATISVFLLIFTINSIFFCFLITAFSFVALCLFGYITKRDLGPVGSFCSIGLVGLVFLSLIIIIFPTAIPGTEQQLVNGVGILIFAGLTAYDTQRIKKEYVVDGTLAADKEKAEIRGALDLYLDFLNLFLRILVIFGKRR